MNKSCARSCFASKYCLGAPSGDTPPPPPVVPVGPVVPPPPPPPPVVPPGPGTSCVDNSDMQCASLAAEGNCDSKDVPVSTNDAMKKNCQASCQCASLAAEGNCDSKDVP